MWVWGFPIWKHLVMAILFFIPWWFSYIKSLCYDKFHSIVLYLYSMLFQIYILWISRLYFFWIQHPWPFLSHSTLQKLYSSTSIWNLMFILYRNLSPSILSILHQKKLCYISFLIPVFRLHVVPAFRTALWLNRLLKTPLVVPVVVF